MSVPGGADVAIKPDTGNSIGINASGDTKARRFFGCRDGAGTDPHRFSQGADRGAIPTGAGNAGVRRLQGVI